MKYVIIEDENPAAARLQRLLHSIRPEAQIMATLDSIEDAVAYFRDSEVDLAFFDIQLADGQSFKIFEQVEVPCPVIFTTAHDEYALRAFKVNSVDYLLKPIDENELKSAIERFEDQRLTGGSQTEDLRTLLSGIGKKENFRKRFLIRSGQKLNFVPVQDIAWFISEASTSFLVTHGNDRFLIEQTLDDLENELDPENFFRVNRKMIVNIAAIERIENYFNSRLLLGLKPSADEEAVVSRQRVKEFKSWIDS